MDARHRQLAEIALAAGGKHGLALAGGYAVRAHGMGDRPSGDVDLFTDWERRADFPIAVNLVIDALSAAGLLVTVGARSATFARLLISYQDDAPGSSPQKLEMAADRRAHPPVSMEVGPVLHPDDAVANKVGALFGRALARDFLDVDAILRSGRYTREDLLRLGAAADGGFDRIMFAHALGAAEKLEDEAFLAYDVDMRAITSMREMFTQWRRQLLEAGD